jgi:hypothetical protein
MGLALRGATGVAEAPFPEAPCVVRSIVLLTAAVVVGRISTVPGVKLHEAWSGRPEQERITNIGEVSAEASRGVTEAVMVPDWPAVSEREAGEAEI